MFRIAAAAAACLLAGPAAGQIPCLVGPPDMLDKILATTGEEPLIEMQMGGGPETATTPTLLTVAPDGSFTLFALSENGAVCIVAHGTHAQPVTGKGFPQPIVSGRDS